MSDQEGTPSPWPSSSSATSSPASSKKRKLGESSSPASSSVSFDKLPPDVICSEILTRIVVDIAIQPALQFRRRSGLGVEERSPFQARAARAMWTVGYSFFDMFQGADVDLVYADRDDMPIHDFLEMGKSTCLFGRFRGDIALRFPWLIFRSIRIYDDHAWLAGSELDDDDDFLWSTYAVDEDPMSLDLIQQFVTIRMKQVVFLQLPSASDWSKVSEPCPNLLGVLVWDTEFENLLGVLPNDPGLAAVACSSLMISSQHTLRQIGIEMSWRKIVLDDALVSKNPAFEVSELTVVGRYGEFLDATFSAVGWNSLRSLALIGTGCFDGFVLEQSLPELPNLVRLVMMDCDCSLAGNPFSHFRSNFLEVLVLGFRFPTYRHHQLKFSMPVASCLRRLSVLRCDCRSDSTRRGGMLEESSLMQLGLDGPLRFKNVFLRQLFFRGEWISKCCDLRCLRLESVVHRVVEKADLQTAEFVHLKNVECTCRSGRSPRDGDCFVELLGSASIEEVEEEEEDE